MIIRLAKLNNAKQIAKIHQDEIKYGFLSQLGLHFLTKFYTGLIESSGAFVVIAENNDCPVAFISGCIDTAKFSNKFYKKKLLSMFFILLPKMIKPGVLKKIVETFLHSKKKDALPKAELLSIAVQSEYQNQGMGKKLFQRFLSEMKERQIKQFKVLVGTNLKQAINFYQNLGFQEYSSASIHKDKPSKIFLYHV